MIKLYCTTIEGLKNPGVAEQLSNKVNMQRRSKLLRCKNEKDRLLSLAAGLLFRYAIEQEGILYEQLDVTETKEGKPYVAEAAHLYFSLSHAGNMAVCVLADEMVGVDIEEKDRMQAICKNPSRLERILHKIATEHERKWFYETKKEKQSEALLHLWTGKESYGKAYGYGISYSMNEMETIELEQNYFSMLTQDYGLSVYIDKKVSTEIENITEEINPQWIDVAKEYLK